MSNLRASDLDGSEIAVVGMSGRFPGARNLAELWRNLVAGKESIRRLSRDELRALGAPQRVLDDPDWVPAVALLDDYDRFDAAFFDISHREAEITDPQHRVLLECAWSALEDAGYQPSACPGAVGVFAGATINTYLLLNLFRHPTLVDSLEPVQINIGNGGDFLATRIAYQLGLEGPAVTVQSACSTSLVAVHTACQSLYSEECDMALAGGVSVNVSQRFGYRHVQGGMASPDGRCRPFDAAAEGTLFGGGAGLVVLKRLENALADGDAVRAVIKGSAINNDGCHKVGYTAPGVEGQAKVIAEALGDAGVEPETIAYVEAHGTATPLGDPIEVEALTKAYRSRTQARGFCGIGSVKSNVGHLDAAAGIAGFLKLVLALVHRHIPPSLHFTRANPAIDFAATPFFVQAEGREWTAGRHPRRGAVSAFGVGGTNAHLILQEAPPEAAPDAGRRRCHLLPLSAKSAAALERATADLAEHLDRHPDLPLADVAHTLLVGRHPGRHRRLVVAEDAADAARCLADPGLGRRLEARAGKNTRPVAFLLPGQGTQRPGLTRELYAVEPAFREALDRCSELLRPHLGLDLPALLYPADGEADAAAERLRQTRFTQPALFAVEYALAQLWRAWGIEPEALLGHSLGEYVAATLAGVFRFEDAVSLVARRGDLMQALPAGAMLSVPLMEEELRPLLGPGLDLAAVNGPGRLVVAGPPALVADLEADLEESGIRARRLVTSHAFHSAMMEPMVADLGEALRALELSPPEIPFLSNLTGTWIEPDQATDPDYWLRHLRRPVRFSDNLRELFARPERLLLEVGPGIALSQLARRHPARPRDLTVIPSFGEPKDGSEEARLLTSAGRLWLAGADLDRGAPYRGERRRRVSLPTYPFERRRYWIEPGEGPAAAAEEGAPQAPAETVGEPRFYLPAFRPTPHPRGELVGRWLVLCPEPGAPAAGAAEAICLQMVRAGAEVLRVLPGASDGDVESVLRLRPGSAQHAAALFGRLRETERAPRGVVSLWQLEARPADPEKNGAPLDASTFDAAQEHGLLALSALVQGWLREMESAPLEVAVIADGVLDPDDGCRVEKAPLEALPLVLSQEYGHLRCRLLDVRWPTAVDAREVLCRRLIADLAAGEEPTVAWRGTARLVRSAAAVELATRAADAPLRRGDVHLVTGGLADIGFVLAQELAAQPESRLILLEDAEDRTSDGELREARRARLEALGAKTVMEVVDFSDVGSVATAVARSREHFGPPTTLVHAVRVKEALSFRTVAETGPAEAAVQLVPKVHGLLSLLAALGPELPPIRFLSSSLASYLGGVGSLAYTAASQVLDRFAAYGFTVVDWDVWSLEGKDVQLTDLSEELARRALAPAAGVELFRRALAAGPGRYMVSTSDLEARRRQLVVPRTAGAEGSAAGGHPRPELDIPFVPPADELEERLAEVWQSVLGLDRVGVLDNFFDLGGDSLLAVQTADRLKRLLDREIPTVSLYEGLTVRSLARLLNEQATEDAGGNGRQAGLEEREGRRQRRAGYRDKKRLRSRSPGVAT